MTEMEMVSAGGMKTSMQMAWRLSAAASYKDMRNAARVVYQPPKTIRSLIMMQRRYLTWAGTIAHSEQEGMIIPPDDTDHS
jgi:hypothetical protein